MKRRFALERGRLPKRLSLMAIRKNTYSKMQRSFGSVSCMPPPALMCLITIRRDDILYPRFVKCIVDGAKFVVIPLDDYDLPRANGRSEIMVRVTDEWFGPLAGTDVDLICHKIIDLDEFDHLEWLEVPPSAD